MYIELKTMHIAIKDMIIFIILFRINKLITNPKNIAIILEGF